MTYANRFNVRPASHESPRRHSVAYFTAGFVTAAVFGPYITLSGIRTEHIAVYGTLLVGLIFCVWTRLRATTAGALILLLLLIEALVAILGIVQPVTNHSGIAPGNTLAGLDNLLLPVAALLVALMLASSGADTTRLLRIVCTVLVVAMCVNGVLAYLSSIRDMTWLLSQFWDSQTSQRSVADQAAEMGRFSGMINQPAEAGTLYGMSVLAAIYLYREHALKMGISMLLLTIGGVLTISKVFLLVGLPIAAWQAVRVSGPRLRRLVVFLALAIFAAMAARSGLVLSGVGSAYFGRLLHPSGGANDVMDLYTAGRFGSTWALQVVTEAVLNSSPWFGFGARGLAAAYDNAWVEALVIAGVAGAAIYTAVLTTLALSWLRRRLTNDAAQSSFAGGLVLLVIGASTGIPALTANRVATVAWLLISFLLLSPAQKPVQPGRSVEGPSMADSPCDYRTAVSMQ
jgi:hypothetical protein